MTRRVFLLGLDGASWNVLDRMIAIGAMPNLGRLCREGVRATLESTVPAITPCAWNSLMTGCNPGKHGVFGFMKKSESNSYLPVPVNRMDTLAPTIFDYFGEGGPLISLNLPMSYPATPINGAMVTCMMTPLRNPGDFEHPRGLLARFARAGIDYTIDPKFRLREGAEERELFENWRQEGPAFVSLLGDITRNRMRAAGLLMDEEPWDAFVTVIVGTDRLQHLHWDRLLPPDGSDPDPLLASYYRQVDDHLGELAGRLGAGETLLIVSDHGFTRHHGAFLANEWLRRQGWLARREAARSPLYPLKRALGAVGLTRARLTRLLGRQRASRLQLAAAHVDWARSHAWLDNPFGLRLNRRGRETLGLVAPEEASGLLEEMAARLRGGLLGPDGEPLLSAVHFGADLYWGEGRAQASDLVFTFRDDRNHGAYAGNVGGELFRPVPYKTGDHRIDGMFVAWGGGVRGGAAPPDGAAEWRFKIWDVLPTLLHLNGRAVPGICDGRVLREILADDRPPVVDQAWRRFLSTRRAVAYTGDQAAEIAERLRDLGYLSDD